MMEIDNRSIRLGDELKKEIKPGSKVKIAATTFSMFAFQQLKEEFETINSSPIQFDKIVLDNRLRERKLSSTFIKDSEFEDSIKYLWQNPSESLSEGESNQDALARVLNFLIDLEERYSDKTILLSSHGNLLGILINHFDSSFDYKKWGQMTFPDCFLVDKDESVKRIMEVTSR